MTEARNPNVEAGRVVIAASTGQTNPSHKLVPVEPTVREAAQAVLDWWTRDVQDDSPELHEMFETLRDALAASPHPASGETEPVTDNGPLYDKVTVGGEDFVPARTWVAAPDYYIVAVNEFLSDWQKADFSLSTLAALDAQSIVSAGERWAAEEAMRAALSAALGGRT